MEQIKELQGAGAFVLQPPQVMLDVPNILLESGTILTTHNNLTTTHQAGPTSERSLISASLRCFAMACMAHPPECAKIVAALRSLYSTRKVHSANMFNMHMA